MSAIVSVGEHVASIAIREAVPLSVYTSVWFVLHILCEAVIPALFPGIYDALGRADEAKGKKTTRARLAARARTMIVCTLQGLYLTAVCAYGLWSESEMAALYGHHYASTPLSRHIVLVAASFFIWDLFVCIYDGESYEYYAHAVACLFVFLAGLNPFVHYMSFISLLFEASTPWLHARSLLLHTRNASGPLWVAVNLAFSAAFFATRIVIGLTASVDWWRQMLTLLHTGAHNDAVVVGYLACNLLLCSLNVFWAVRIASALFAAMTGSTGKAKPAKTE